MRVLSAAGIAAIGVGAVLTLAFKHIRSGIISGLVGVALLAAAYVVSIVPLWAGYVFAGLSGLTALAAPALMLWGYFVREKQISP